MKKSILFISVVLCFSIIKAQDWTEFTASESTTPSYSVINSNDTIVRFNVVVSGMFETSIDTFNRVNIKEHTKMDSVGYPEMPVVSFLVAIPDCDSVNLNIEIMDSTQFSGYNIYPAPELVPDTAAGGGIALIEQFAYNRSAYETNAMFPGTVAEAIDKGAIRDQHVVRVVLYPMQFNPIKDIIKAYSDFQITLTFNNPIGSINEDVGIFNEVVGNTLINYNSNGLNASVSCGTGLDNNEGSIYWVNALPNNKVDSTCDYLIVTPRDFYIDTVARNKIEELAQHRANFNGFDVAIVRTSTIDSFINVLPDMFLYEKMQHLIKETYESNNANHTYDGKLAYVNLFGDVELQNGSPGVPTYSEGYDIYFSRLTEQGGTYDVYPDLMLGRCSVDTVTQVQNVVHKILNFKPDALDWNDDMLMVTGSDSGHFWFQSQVLSTMDEVIGNTYDITYVKPHNFNFPYPNWDTMQSYDNAAVLSAYAYGQMFINYIGHGASWGWVVGDSIPFAYTLLTSSHDNILPVIFSNSCGTGAFQSTINEDCMGEEFLCSDSARGSIAFIGAPVSTAVANAKMVPAFYDGILNNYLYTMGESLMETQLNPSIYSPDDFNLLGDPGLNIIYENIDTLKPDLIMKKSEISFQSAQNNIGDTISINAIIRNNSIIDIESSFYVACYLGDPEISDAIKLDSIQVDSLSGYVADTLSFTWKTAGFDPGYKKIYIDLDIHDSIDELSDNNNTNYSKIVLTGYYNGFPTNVSNSNNSSPISFDIDDDYDHEEIIIGENVLTCEGELITSYSQNSNSYTSIGNINNDEEFQVVVIQTGTSDSLKCFNDELLWTYPLTNYNYGPAIADINNDGKEEILLTNTFLDANNNSYMNLICLNSDGTLRWTYDDLDSVPHSSMGPATAPGYIPLIGPTTNNNSKIIYLTREDGKIFLIREITIDSAQVTNTVNLDDCSLILNSPIASDIDKDGYLNILFYYIDTSNNRILSMLNTDSLNIEYSYTCENSNYDNPIFSDINNDGFTEVLIAENNSGIHLLNNELDSIGFISEPDIVFTNIVSGDFDDDYNNDIVCNIMGSSDEKSLKIFNSIGNSIFEIPVNILYAEYWLSDIDKDEDIEIIFGKNETISIIDIPNAGSSIGWPGQQGNISNTGVLEQPAFFGSTGDTVYWSNTISLTGDNTISGSTVIIKPGTTINAHAGASLVVDGKLVAEGTESHPIVFKADINSADNDYWQGITISYLSLGSFMHCKISDAEIGLLVEDDNHITISDCHFSNSLVGIGAYNSAPEIFQNFIFNNDVGIYSWHNAAPVLTDYDKENPFRNGIIDNQTGIKVINANVYLKSGYNDIYGDSTCDYYIYFTGGLSSIEIDAGNNYWGTTNTTDINEMLYPSKNIIIKPICQESQSPYSPPSGSASAMLKTAYNSIESEEYQTAETTFKGIINLYPTTTEAYLSVSGLCKNTRKSNGNWNNLENYLFDLYNDSTISNDFKKLAFSYLNLCKRKQGNYTGAIANYESIILNNPTYNDSVYAVIDIGNTYEEAGNYKSSMGQLSFLAPASRGAHVKKSVDLLLSLKPEEPIFEQKNSSGFYISDVFPNPFKDKCTIKYHASFASTITFGLFDVSGKKMDFSKTIKTHEGNHNINLDFSFLKPGVYYITLSGKGQVNSVKKLVVK